jgi:hypothetical protein
MTIPYLEALFAIDLSLSVLMAARLGGVATHRQFGLGRYHLVGAGQRGLADPEGKRRTRGNGWLPRSSWSDRSGLMSITSTVIDTAERAPLPDVVVRAAIQLFCARTAVGRCTSCGCMSQNDSRANDFLAWGSDSFARTDVLTIQ